MTSLTDGFSGIFGSDQRRSFSTAERFAPGVPKRPCASLHDSSMTPQIFL